MMRTALDRQSGPDANPVGVAQGSLSGVTLRRIVVPVTLAHRYDRGVSLAANMAERWGVPVHLVSIDVTGDTEADTRAALSQTRRAVASAHPAVTIDDELVLHSDPVAAAVSILTTADMVVLATDGSQGDRRASFAQALAQEWGGPVVMVGPNATSHLVEGEVVVALDGSALAERVLPVARWLAERQVGMRLVHVVRPDVADHVARLRAAGETVSESAYIRDVGARVGGPGTEIRWTVLHSEDPAEVLVDYVEREDIAFLVMATHGATGLVRATFGSTTMDVVAKASRPVWVQSPHPSSSVGELTTSTTWYPIP